LGVLEHRPLAKVDLRFLAGGAFQEVDTLGEPAVTSVVQFGEKFQMGFSFHLP
jgi:hypothetical protein